MSLAKSVLLAFLVLGATVGGLVLATGTPPGTPSETETAPAGLETFDSRADFLTYWERSNRLFQTRNGRYLFHAEPAGLNTAETLEVTADTAAVGSSSAPRHSTTNVQERGIGEPDVVKTDGSVAYYSPPPRYPLGHEHPRRTLHVLGVSPPGLIDSIAAINDSGRMLRAGDTLVVLGHDAVVGYNVSDPEHPERTWKRGLDGRIAGARLVDGDVFLVVSSGDPEAASRRVTV